jgi:DNA mismatch endonuclease (patch repair protein)
MARSTRPDPFTPDERSAVMRAVKSRDTGPEWKVRRLSHRLGYRHRLHDRALPGAPDLVFPGRRKAVFVHGCFWHGHDCPRGQRRPKANAAYWDAKIARTCARDAASLAALEAMGWQALVLWECSLKDEAALIERLHRFLR